MYYLRVVTHMMFPNLTNPELSKHNLHFRGISLGHQSHTLDCSIQTKRGEESADFFHVLWQQDCLSFALFHSNVDDNFWCCVS